MNITEPVSAWARATPDAPVVLAADAGLSYAELERAVSWTAGEFKKAGVGPGDVVGIHLTGQVRHLVASLALARLGAGQIAFSDADPPRRRREIARRLGLVATVADKSTETATEGPLLDPPPGRIADLIGLKPADIEAAADGTLPFKVVPTSGTNSGIPKLSAVTHRAAHSRLKHLVVEGPACRFISTIDMNYTAAKRNAYRCLISGGCVALLENLSPGALVDVVAAHRITYFFGTPNHAAALLRIADEGALLFPDLKAFQLGTTVVPEALRTDIQERLTPNLYIRYAATEVGTISVATPDHIGTVPGTVGKVVPGMEIEIVDEEGRSVPPGNVGRLRARSDGMIDGYVDAPDETALAFRDGWFHSGDLVALTPDGNLIHHGRADDLMIADGVNIYPAEIEDALLRHPAVAEAAAFPIRSRVHRDIPAPAVTVKSPVSGKELLSHCRSWIGEHSPRAVMIVPKLPRNPAGKILKRELVRMFHEQRRRQKES